MSQRWRDCLDRFAEHLAAQQEALVDGRPEDVSAFDAPAGLGPVPRELSERLRALAAENDQLVAAVAAATASCARQLQLLTVLHRPQPASASFVDARG